MFWAGESGSDTFLALAIVIIITWHGINTVCFVSMDPGWTGVISCGIVQNYFVCTFLPFRYFRCKDFFFFFITDFSLWYTLWVKNAPQKICSQSQHGESSKNQNWITLSLQSCEQVSCCLFISSIFFIKILIFFHVKDNFSCFFLFFI